MLGVGAAGPVGADGPSRPRRAGRDAGPTRPRTDARRNATRGRSWPAVRGLGPVGFGVLLERYGSGVAILREASSPGGPERMVEAAGGRGRDDRAGRPRRARRPTSPRRSPRRPTTADGRSTRIRELGLAVVTIEDPAYPARLAAIEMPPHLLYVLGDPAAMRCRRGGRRSSGTRRATERRAGRRGADRRRASSRSGRRVVSGLAVGIDGAAHAAAVHAGGTTVAVIGSGHAVLAPARPQPAGRCDRRGGWGGRLGAGARTSRPSTGTFPRRNRVISGLADATVVVEAPARSGALITASWALEQGRDCFLVPGPIDAPASAGCLAFLREFPDRARIVAGIPQLIADLGLADRLAEPRVRPDAAATLADVGEVAGRLGREIVHGRATVDELVAVTGLAGRDGARRAHDARTTRPRRSASTGAIGRPPEPGCRRPGDARRQRPSDASRDPGP